MSTVSEERPYNAADRICQAEDCNHDLNDVLSELVNDNTITSSYDCIAGLAKEMRECNWQAIADRMDHPDTAELRRQTDLALTQMYELYELTVHQALEWQWSETNIVLRAQSYQAARNLYDNGSSLTAIFNLFTKLQQNADSTVQLPQYRQPYQATIAPGSTSSTAEIYKASLQVCVEYFAIDDQSRDLQGARELFATYQLTKTITDRRAAPIAEKTTLNQLLSEIATFTDRTGPARLAAATKKANVTPWETRQRRGKRLMKLSLSPTIPGVRQLRSVWIGGLGPGVPPSCRHYANLEQTLFTSQMEGFILILYLTIPGSLFAPDEVPPYWSSTNAILIETSASKSAMVPDASFSQHLRRTTPFSSQLVHVR